MNNGQAVSTLFPGRQVVLDDVGVKAMVYPVGVRHLKKFSQQIAVMGHIISHLEAKFEAKPGMDQQQIQEAKLAALRSQIAAQLVPFVLNKGMEIMAECVVLEPKSVTLDDLPHWHLPVLAEAWLLESFSEEKKWRPWTAAVDSLIQKATGKDISISGIFSKLLSGLDTILTRSSTVPQESSPTQAGA